MVPAGIKKLIQQAKAAKASDIHICVGAPVLFRVGKDLIPATAGKVTAELAERLAFGMLTSSQIQQFRAQLDYDLMISDEQGRYRVNISLNDRAVGAVIRILPEEARSIESLGLPPVVKQLAGATKGLVLITGATSQGKTTTMSAIIDEINTHHSRHIITIEDPIETLHTPRLSIIRQREVGRDTKTFASGLRAALRQDPDVIAIGEMRDYETIKIALTAAETGVLVLSTLHVISIDKVIERLLSYGPQEDHDHLRLLMAGALQGAIHQELVPAVAGGKRVACEVLMATDAVKNIIRRRDGFMLRNVIHTGGRYGMVSMKQSIAELIAKGLVAPEVAETVLVNYG
ncbi:MAG: type IV pilus twitching motility protein PilT [Phycisphaerae bacterium]